MFKTFAPTPLIAVAVLLVSACSHNQEASLLGGHLTMTLPAEAELQGGAPANRPGVGDTIYTIGEGDKKISVRALELIQFAGPDFVADSTKDMEELRRRPEYKGHEIGTIGDNIVYLLISRPPAPEYARSDTFRYGMADVRNADGMVQHIMFYFGSDYAQDIPACRKFILDALHSIKAGKTPDIGARRVDVAEFGDETLKLTLPEGYFHTYREGPDFDVHQYREVRKHGAKGSGILLYLGGHPYMRGGSAGTRKGTLLGQKVEWNLSQDSTFHTADAIVPVAVTAPVLMHVRINAESREKLDTLISAAEGMSLSPKGKGE